MEKSEFYTTLALEIIHEQEQVIGPLAWEQAKKVKGLKVEGKSKLAISVDPQEAINSLVKQFAELFGKASVRVCHQAGERVFRKFAVDKGDIPESLRM